MIDDIHKPDEGSGSTQAIKEEVRCARVAWTAEQASDVPAQAGRLRVTLEAQMCC